MIMIGIYHGVLNPKKNAPTTLHQVTKHKNTIEKVNFKYAVPFQVI